VGAGAGASVGKLFGMGRAMKGGIGTAAVKVGKITIGAIVAVNAVGDVIDPTSGAVVAGARTEDGRRKLGVTQAILRGELPPSIQAGMATTIG
ncbi:P1 family peptidase, partial [Acinetobacter baumannii]|uniref:P1 family peptidase n=1 Tax=Acinetobacter baumannii TaxID=470 RepID=UPI00148F5B5B